MLCSCGQPAAFADLCKTHFIEHVERTVAQTINEFKLILPEDKVVVAVSGGKDSLTVAYILHKLGYTIDLLAVDEGIAGYRDRTLVELEAFCAQQGLSLKTVSFKEQFGKTLDDFKPQHPCTTCGTFRRYLLNLHAKGYTKIATGHNLDDEAQTILMNVLKGQPVLLQKLGPITKKSEHFTQRIKPLYFCKEKEILAYAFLQGFPCSFHECPHTKDSYRDKIRQTLNEEEQRMPGAKRNVVAAFLDMQHVITDVQPFSVCTHCGEAARGALCRACMELQRT